MRDFIAVLSLLVISISSVTVFFYLIRLFKAALKKATTASENRLLEVGLKELDDAIRASITAVNRHMVAPMRQEGELTQLDKEEAFVYCKTRVLQSMSRESLRSLHKTYGDIHRLLSNRIESLIRSGKR